MSPFGQARETRAKPFQLFWVVPNDETKQTLLSDFPELRDAVWTLHYAQRAIRKLNRGQTIIYNRRERKL